MLLKLMHFLYFQMLDDNLGKYPTQYSLRGGKILSTKIYDSLLNYKMKVPSEL